MVKHGVAGLPDEPDEAWGSSYQNQELGTHWVSVPRTGAGPPAPGAAQSTARKAAPARAAT